MSQDPYRVLFVCLGNACRSQMAEGFARAYGKDIVAAESAGLTPAAGIPDVTAAVMREKGIDLAGQRPKGIESVTLGAYRVVANLSGLPVSGSRPGSMREWKVRDPMGESDAIHRAVRDQIEGLVMGLLLELRKARAAETQKAADIRERTRPRLRGI